MVSGGATVELGDQQCGDCASAYDDWDCPRGGEVRGMGVRCGLAFVSGVWMWIGFGESIPVDAADADGSKYECVEQQLIEISKFEILNHILPGTVGASVPCEPIS